MVKGLLKLLTWFDQRYPPKHRITEEMWKNLEFRVLNCETYLSNLNMEFNKLSIDQSKQFQSLNGIKESIIKGDIPLRPTAEKIREDFISGNWKGVVDANR